MLATTSSKSELVGSLEAAPRMTDAEEAYMSSVVAMVLGPGFRGLTVTSPEKEVMVGIDAERSTSSVVVGSLVNVGTKVSPVMILDKLSTTPKEVAILEISDVMLSITPVSLLKIVELDAVSASEANGVSITEEIESALLSSG